jgi:hypothetical protein
MRPFPQDGIKTLKGVQLPTKRLIDAQGKAERSSTKTAGKQTKAPLYLWRVITAWLV